MSEGFHQRGVAAGSSRSTGRATLSDVARLAGVSAMTASRALRGERTVDAALAERVLAAAQKLGYVPDPAARALASHRSSHVAVLVPSLTNALFVDLLEAAQRVLRGAGFQTLIGITHYDAAEEEQLVREQLLHRPAGVLLTGLGDARTTRQQLAAQQTPCVCMMELPAHGTEAALPWPSAAPGGEPGAAQPGARAEPGLYSVGFSQVDAAAAMTRHLLARGRQRIAFAAAQLDPRTLQRLQGWRQELGRSGGHDPRLEWLDPAPSSVGLGAQMFEQIRAAQPEVDAIFFCNDDLAHGALLAALRMGVQVPRQIAIAGFNDLPESAHMVPPLTTVRTPRAEVGEQAAKLLLSLIRKEPPPASTLDLGFELVQRAST